jgi:transposase
MRKRWCHDHKTWTPDNWKRTRDIVRWVVLHGLPCITQSLRLKNTQASLQSGMLGSNSETSGRFSDVLGSNIVVQCSVDSIIILHDWITAREYLDRLGNQVNSWSRRYFLSNNDAVFLDDNAPIHRIGTVKSWFEEDEGELQQLPWPTQSQDLNIIEPLWSVLETRVRNRFLPSTSLKQLEDVLQGEWYKIRLETVRNLYESIPRRTVAVLKAKAGPTPY